MKIALFFKNSKVSNVDASKPELGNPGFGGRQFMNLNIAYHLSCLDRNRILPVLYCEKESLLPDIVKHEVCNDIFNALKQARSDGIDYFILDASLDYRFMDELIGLAEQLELKVLFRLGLIPSASILKRMYWSSAVVCVICVEQYVFELLRDHPVFIKTTVMTNGIPIGIYGKPLPVEKKQNYVVYLGSLVPQKGFDILARIWKSVVAEVPDARLKVCGLGTLYGEHNVLGKWGVASEKFEENAIRPYLSGPNGEPMPSVQFLGNLGFEKIELLKQAMVGVANPSGATETFCISAVEIQAAGTVVIAGAKDGLFDTVNNGHTGYLIKKDRELAEKIIYLLKNTDTAVEMGRSGNVYTSEKYDMANIAKKWDQLLHELADSKNISRPDRKIYSGNLALKAIYINSLVRKILGSPSWWPSYVDFTSMIRAPVAVKYNKLKKYFKSRIN